MLLIKFATIKSLKIQLIFTAVSKMLIGVAIAVKQRLTLGWFNPRL